MVWWVVAAAAAKGVLGAGSQIQASAEQIKTQRTQLARQISEINIQRAASRTRTNAALFNVQQGKQQALSQVGLNAAASGTIGASVADAVSTVNVGAGRNTAGIRQAQAEQEDTFFRQATAAVDTSVANTPKESGSDMLFNSLLGAAGSAVGQLAGDAATSDAFNFDYSSWGQGISGTLSTWKSYLGGGNAN